MSTVELIDSMGDDLRIANAARVSFSKHHEEMVDADRGLIGFLMRERHGTPFEMVQFQFRVHTPVKVAREWQRHRIGSYNEVSTRYVEIDPFDYYLPEGGQVRRQVGKAGAYSFEVMEEIDDVRDVMNDACRFSAEQYQKLLAMGVAKELASFVLPMGWNTTFMWSVNLRSVLNFLSLRNAPTALLEIREAAEMVEKHVEAVCPVAYAAFVQHGRVAP